MSTKTTKKTTISTSSVSSSVQTPPQPGTSSSQTTHSQGRSSSPLSPTRYSRLQEKADLQNLNDRLANYIDRVRHLEAENSRLTREVRTSNETTTREVTSVRTLYENELSEARKLLDEVSREKARLEMDTRRLFNENQDLSEKLDKKTKDLSMVETTITVLESRVADLTTKYNQAQADRKKLADEVKNLEKERDKLLLECADLRKNYENETLKRVDFENALQTVKEELAFKEQMYQQQLIETRTKRQVEISEIDGRLSQEYDEKLSASLQEIRDQYEIDLKNNKEDIKLLYEEKLKSLSMQMSRNGAAAATAIDEMRKMSSRMESQSGQFRDLENQNTTLNLRIRELEKMLEADKARHIEDYTRMDQEITRLQEEMARQMQEYQDLMDIKVALDLEIAAYRKLLEGEESRLNITPASTPGGKLAGPRTPLRRGTPLRGKRKRTMLENTEEESMADFSIKSTAKGEIEFQEICPEGRFVKLFNKGNKEVVLGGWQIVRKAGEEATNFKFHRSVKVEPGATVTIWSANTEQVHEPPSNLVMKSQQWVVGDQTTTTLINTNGDEVAIVERSRQQMTTSSSRTRHGSGYLAYRSMATEDLYHQQGDPQGEERCAIM